MDFRKQSRGQAIPYCLTICVIGLTLLPGCVHRHKKSDLALPVNPGDQPDKVLYEKASNEINHSRYDVGRLTLQTLINTYPDSEYLAKAKLAIADSYYKEGGVSGLTQAEAEYKDFITFFPTAPEAPEAQYRAGMAHHRLMAKADRDRAEAKIAEGEFKEFLLKYPDSPLVPRVKRRLREVQEVLAEGDFKIAKFYYQRGSIPAAKSRFQDIVDLYPNFSQSDEALYYLGRSLERLRKPNDAIPYYARIITDHPLSPYVGNAKEKLTAVHQPIPKPTKAMLARAEADAAHRSHKTVVSRMEGVVSSEPDLSATRHGPVELGPRKQPTVQAAAPAPGATGNTITVQPVGDEALKDAKPAESKRAAPNNQTQDKDQDKSQNPKPTADPPPSGKAQPQ